MKEWNEVVQGAMIGGLVALILKAISWTRPPSSAYTDYWGKGCYVPLPGG